MLPDWKSATKSLYDTLSAQSAMNTINSIIFPERIFMFQYTKYLAGTIALLLGTSLFASEDDKGLLPPSLTALSMTSAVAPGTPHADEEVAETSQKRQERVDIFNTFYVLKNPYAEHTEDDLASYRRYLAAEIQPGERPENVPTEAIYTKDGIWALFNKAKIIDSWNLDGTPHLAAATQPEKPENVPVEAIYSDKGTYNDKWILVKNGNVLDAWNQNGTLSQPLYAWWVYFGTYGGATAASDYSDFVKAYEIKFSDVHVDEELFKTVVTPYQQVSTIFPKAGHRQPKYWGHGPTAIDCFLNNFMTQVVPAACTVNPVGLSSSFEELKIKG